MSWSLSRLVIAAATAVTIVISLGACATGGSSSSPIRVGWIGEIPPLDPAASSSSESFDVLTQIYPSLLVVEADHPDPVPEIAESAEWTANGVYTVVLKRGLEFANGDDLTASDVKFSLERQLALQPADGAWRGLAGLDSIEIIDDTTIEFRIGAAIDTGLPFVLAGPAGLVLDEEAFFADELTADDDIVAAQAFAGPYVLESRDDDRLRLTPFAGFGGSQGANSVIELRTGPGAGFSRELSDGSIDVLTGPLPRESLESLIDDEGLDVTRAVSGQIRMLAFDFAHMPFGSRTETPDATKAGAVRAAIGELIDRDLLADSIGGAWVDPAFGYIAHGVSGSSDVLTDRYGDGEGGPDLGAATAVLTAAAIPTPVDLSIHVDVSASNERGAAEVTAVADQLDESGLFDVTTVETDADGLGAAFVAGEVQAVLASVMPVTRDPRAYLDPFRSTELLAPGYADATVDGLLVRSTTEADPQVRAATLLEAQSAIAGSLPAIPLTQEVRVVFVRGTISGFDLVDALPFDLSRLRR